MTRTGAVDEGEGLGSQDKLFADWVMHLTGCTFAKSLSKAGRVMTACYQDASLLPMIEAQIDDAAVHGSFAAAGFPTLPCPGGIAYLLYALNHRAQRTGRWRVEVAEVDGETASACVLWKTAQGEWSNVMGLAPSTMMPATRRAPYVGIAVWGGARENPFYSGPGDELGLLDGAPPGALATDRDAYDTVKAAMRESMDELFEAPFKERRAYFRMAFRFPLELADTARGQRP